MKYRVTAERAPASQVWELRCVEVPEAAAHTTQWADAPRLIRQAIAEVKSLDPDDVEIEMEGPRLARSRR